MNEKIIIVDEDTKRFRAIITKHIAALQKDLGGFWETTHSLIASETPIDGVYKSIASLWKKTSPYTMGNLTSYIQLLLKQQSEV